MPKTRLTQPREDGFRMPGEFEPHQGCWMLWPEREDTWRLGAKPAQSAFTEVARQIACFEPVTMGVSAHQYENARCRLPESVRVVEITSNDAWMRDVGPTFVTHSNGTVRGIDWRFNAWGGLKGGCYFPWDQDDLVARKVLEIETLDRYAAPLILEGGAIHVDGQGTLITTRECLLNRNRNADMTREQIETVLRTYLNVSTIIWLERGLWGDETDGHVDNLCCFIRPAEVILNWTDDRADPQYDICHHAWEVLTASRDARGRHLKIHKIRQPAALYVTSEEIIGMDPSCHPQPQRKGDRLTASYVNFYMANNGIVMPLFDDATDAGALQTMRTLFPERRVVGISSREILLGGGNIHCITQQQPAGGTIVACET